MSVSVQGFENVCPHFVKIIAGHGTNVVTVSDAFDTIYNLVVLHFLTLSLMLTSIKRHKIFPEATDISNTELLILNIDTLALYVLEK